MEQHILSAENLQLGYDGRVIVDGMEAVIPDGKISIIIGANGCGKSTLLKSFARLERSPWTDGPLAATNRKNWRRFWACFPNPRWYRRA